MFSSKNVFLIIKIFRCRPFHLFTKNSLTISYFKKIVLGFPLYRPEQYSNKLYEPYSFLMKAEFDHAFNTSGQIVNFPNGIW